MNEVFLDTETTGLSISDDHRIVEIACIETNSLIPTNNVFHKIINPERKVSEDALKIHGYNDSMLKDKKIFKDISEEFINFIQGKKLIIHNAPFDISFLSLLPNFVIMAASDEIELARMVKTASIYNEGPISFRYPRGSGEGLIVPESYDPIEIGKKQGVNYSVQFPPSIFEGVIILNYCELFWAF